MAALTTIAAVVVTRGDVPVGEIVASLTGYPFTRVVVWDNSRRQNVSVYGRYAAIAETTADLVYCQDDDCVVEPDAISQLVAAHKPGHVVCNMPPEFRHDFYREHALIGFGAVFERELPSRAFERFFFGISPDDTTAAAPLFPRCCDVVFTALTPRILADIPYRNLPHATAADRMYRQAGHVDDRRLMLELALRVHDRTAAP